MEECQLDDLVDLMNDDEGADGTVDGPPSQLDKEDPKKIEMARKLQEMEEQVKLMKEQLGRKNESGSSSITCTPGNLNSGNAPPVDKVERTEVDMFSSTSRSVTDKRLLSPVETNSLEKAEMAAKPASLVKSSTSRALTGEKGEKVRHSIGVTGREREMVESTRRDLADNDFEEFSEFKRREQSEVERENFSQGEVVRGKDKFDLAISKQFADELYDKAGTIVPEDPDQISIEKYNYLLQDSVHLIIQEVLAENPLKFKLQDFQLLTLHCLGSLKNVILVSPTGTGKMLCSYLGILVLQKRLNISKGVGLVTQPLRYVFFACINIFHPMSLEQTNQG